MDLTHPGGVEPTVLLTPARGWKFPYFEDVLYQEKLKRGPIRAVVVYSVERYEVGWMQYTWTGSSTGKEIDFPVVNVDSSAWDELKLILAYNGTMGGLVNVTITDEGENTWRTWREQRGAWWYPFFTAVIAMWNSVNIGLAIWLLSGIGFKRSISTLCLILDIIGSLQRIAFVVDPIRGWVLPYQYQQLMVTWSAPATFSAMMLLAFYWQDAIDTSSMKISSILTKSKYPALFACLVLVIAEIVTSSLRITYALGERSQTLSVTISAGVFAIIIGIVVLWFIYTAIRVILFLRTLRALNSNQKKLKHVTTRASLTLLGIFISLIGAVVVISPQYFQPVGHTMGHFFITLGCSVISTMTIITFQRPKSDFKTTAPSAGGSTSGGPASASAAPRSQEISHNV